MARNRPRLRTLEPTAGGRRASWLELFFDLVFVIAVSHVSHILSEHTDVAGLAKYVALFFVVWWSWIGFTFFADRFETEEPVYRLLMFAGMLAVAGLAITLGGAFTNSGDKAFVFCYVLVRVVLIASYLRAAYHIPLARALAFQYTLGLGTASLLLLVSLLVNPPVRYVLWAIVLLLEVGTPLLYTRTARTLPIDRSHIPERFGLFTIIVLGEAVIVTASGTAGVEWTTSTVAIGCLGFAIAAAIWWINFEFVQDSALRTNSLTERFAYIYGHFFIVASIIAVGIGVENAIKENSNSYLQISTIALFGAGSAVYLLAITIMRLMTGVCRSVFPRLATIMALLSLLYLGRSLPPLVLMAAVMLLLWAEVWLESYLAEEQPDEDAPHLAPCDHASEMTTFRARSHDGCEECRKNNYKWVHLRLCLACGHVGCCDTSVHKHATKHFHTSGHPIMASLEKDESWAWCYVDERFVPIHRAVQS